MASVFAVKYNVSNELFIDGLYCIKEDSFCSCLFHLVVKGCWVLSSAFSVSVEDIV